MADVKTPLVDMDAVRKELDYGAAAAGKKKKAVGAIQKTATTKGPDGTATTVRVVPQMAFGLLGLKEPPGGWHGPFGFLRMVAYAFSFLSAFMILTFFYAVWLQDNFQSLVFCLLLSAASMLAAGAAYSHEGLANQVTKMAKHNDEYSSLNDGFTQQTDDLQKVADRIVQLLGDREDKLEEFKQQMAQLDQLSTLKQISTITRAFIDAQLHKQLFSKTPGDTLDGLLTDSEIVGFLVNSKKTLQERIPNFDMDDLGRAAFFPGLGLTDISLLLAAVNTDVEEEKECFMALLLFFINPGKTGAVQEVMRALRVHLKDDPVFGDEKTLKAEILRLANSAPKDGVWHEHGGERRLVPSRVPPAETRKLARIVLKTFEKEDDEDLGISDDES